MALDEALAEVNRLPSSLDGTYWLEEANENFVSLPPVFDEWKARIPRKMWFVAQPKGQGTVFDFGAWRYDNEYDPPSVRVMENFYWIEELNQFCFWHGMKPMPIDQITDLLPYVIFRAELLKRSVIEGSVDNIRSQRYEVVVDLQGPDWDTIRSGRSDFSSSRLSPNNPLIVGTDLWNRYLRDQLQHLTGMT
jgi:hypothetical protein